LSRLTQSGCPLNLRASARGPGISIGTRANTLSHDNPASDTVPEPEPDEFTAHLAELETLIEYFKTAKATAEAARRR